MMMVSMVPSSAFNGRRILPMPSNGTVLPPIPFTRPDCWVKVRKRVASLTMKRLAPESRTKGKLSVSAAKQKGCVGSKSSGMVSAERTDGWLSEPNLSSVVRWTIVRM